MNSRRLLLIVAVLVVGCYVLLVYLLNLLLLAFPGSQLDRAITLAANLGLLLAILGLICQFSVYNQTIKNQEKLNFVAMTARFTDLQKQFVGNEVMKGFFAEIYCRDEDVVNQTDTELSTDELAVCSIMFQLMEDVVTIHDLTSLSCPKQYDGWLSLFKKWFKSHRVKKAWSVFAHYYGSAFQKYVNLYLID